MTLDKPLPFSTELKINLTKPVTSAVFHHVIIPLFSYFRVPLKITLNQRFNADNKDEPEFLEVAFTIIPQNRPLFNKISS